MLKIYFAGSITAGRHDQPIYESIIAELTSYGQILTELIGSVNLSAQGEPLSDKEIHDRDLAWLMESDCIVAEVTNPSLGVGYEIGIASKAGKPILCLFRSGSERRLSAMISGCPGVIVRHYKEPSEVAPLLQEFFTKISQERS
ncbi:MAG: nucleoside 2-deoxyribosyltransferase [Candidatus Obscuribacterales bacterium]|nr:nucleoside 2-deoxyribosyltransferase [Candidatus Obscuribacterales bacterium]